MATIPRTAALTAVLLVTAQVTAASNRQVKVCMGTVLMPFGMQHAARAQASAIYARIGIDLKWSRLSECVNDGIRIDVEPRAAADLSPKATASAYPFSKSPRRITVYCDRVQAVISGRELSARFILGHILAHELGHVLLRTDAHADTGLMKAHWTHADFGAMSRAPAAIGGIHAKMMHENLDRRAIAVE